MKNAIIYLDEANLEKSIDVMNDEFLLVDDNLFSINKITTILKPKIVFDEIYMNKRMIIEFAYSDKVMPMNVKLVLNFNDVSCLEFVKSSQMINDAQLNSIAEKLFDSLKENDALYDEEKIQKIADDVVLNETILLLTQALNKEDCDITKNDFISKFDTWKTRRSNENKDLEEKMSQLFLQLINVKLS